MRFAAAATRLAESGFVPDSVIRAGIRRLVGERRADIGARNGADLDRFVAMMDRSAVALVPELANEQHYELPPEFFVQVLGTHRKYSCCYWGDGAVSLDEAEEAALELTCRRAKIADGMADGMKILDLGCGWGSFSLWVAQHYPHCSVTSVSNSHPQRRFIEAEAERLGIANIRVITADMNDFSVDDTFDRIVSIEMFEHMRNYRLLFERLADWLSDDGYFFMHIFCHRVAAYEYVDTGPADWMSRHFFSGGIMPAADLPLRFQEHLQLRDRWCWDGRHYRRTAEAWLRNMDDHKETIMPILIKVYGSADAWRWWMRWRMFFLAVSEMFGTDRGQEWYVGHYLFQPAAASEEVL